MKMAEARFPTIPEPKYMRAILGKHSHFMNHCSLPCITSHGWGRSNDLGLWLSNGAILIYHPVIIAATDMSKHRKKENIQFDKVTINFNQGKNKILKWTLKKNFTKLKDSWEVHRASPCPASGTTGRWCWWLGVGVLRGGTGSATPCRTDLAH